MSEQKSKNPLQKLKEKFDDKEEQLEILGTFIRLGVMVWAGFIISLNYISLPGMAKDNSPTPHVNWVDQWNSLMTWNQNIKFYKVNKARDNMPTNQKLKEWEQWEKKGILTYITQAELLDKLSQK